jgi:hypothetical protein
LTLAVIYWPRGYFLSLGQALVDVGEAAGYFVAAFHCPMSALMVDYFLFK